MRTVLGPEQVLPLTCTRSGTCCHGKDIRITPWELARLAQARGLEARIFRDSFMVDAGTRLRLDGPPGWRGQAACSQYDPQQGCSLHDARPLACRLYPLGRERQGEEVRYIHEGRRFPCLDGCPEVTELPRLSVREYLAGQGAEPFAVVRDAYLEMAQDLAEGAIALACEGGLPDQRWREAWGMAVHEGPTIWPAILGGGWHDTLTAPYLEAPCADGPAWIRAHAEAMQELANTAGAMQACVRLFCSALLILHAVGGDASDVGRRWLGRARA